MEVNAGKARIGDSEVTAGQIFIPIEKGEKGDKGEQGVQGIPRTRWKNTC